MPSNNTCDPPPLFSRSRRSMPGPPLVGLCKRHTGSSGTSKGVQMNAISVISPYKRHGQWVFDDPRVGLVQEPFVAGADTWIDRVVADIPNAEQVCPALFRYFSDAPKTLYAQIKARS